MKYLQLIHQNPQTTEDLAGRCGLAEYFALRSTLSQLESDGLIERSRESGWRWSLTDAGRAKLWAKGA